MFPGIFAHGLDHRMSEAPEAHAWRRHLAARIETLSPANAGAGDG